MTYRTKQMCTNALGRPYVWRPINYANLTGRPEPSPLETGFTRPTGRPRSGPRGQLRMIAVVIAPVGLATAVTGLMGLRWPALLTGLCLVAGGLALIKATGRGPG